MISCESEGKWWDTTKKEWGEGLKRYVGTNYYDGGGIDPSQFVVGIDGWRFYLERIDWLAVFRAVAERKASLLRAFGTAFIEPPLTEGRWRELGLKTIEGSLWKKRFWRKEEEVWLSELWLEFAGAPVLRLDAADVGVFGHIQFDRHSPSPGRPAYPDVGEWVVDLTVLSPFAEVVNTPLEGFKVLFELDDPRRHPLGIRLQFERGDVWVMGTLRETHIYDRFPPWHRRGHELGEW